MSLVLLLGPHAWAFTPPAAVWTGKEPQRVLQLNDEEQGRRLRSRAWAAFAQTDGPGWLARFDEATGTPRWMWGRGIPMPTDEGAMVEALQALLERHSTLLGFDPGTLSPARANHSEVTDTWYVEFDALRDGLPTYRGGLSARVKHGNLVLLKVATAPAAPVTGAHLLDADAAIEAAIAAGPASDAVHTETDAVRVLLELKTLAGHELRRVWQVASRTKEPPGRWVSFVDGETGELLSVHNEVRFASGTVTGLTHERYPDGSSLVSSAMPLAEVASSSDADVADENGDYTVNGSGPYTTDLNGDYLRVYNSNGGEGLLSEGSVDLEWTTQDATQAEIDTYKFVHDVKLWGDEVASDVSWVTQPIVGYVNINDVCNAYWDGNVNFFLSGSGCNNTGQIADVVYHEWGHGFHYYSVEAGYVDGSVGEGAGDTTSFLLTKDRYMAPYFFTNGGAIRDVGPDREYPSDLVGEVHEDGLIFAGAMYDLLDLLIDAEGEEAGTLSTSRIFAGLLKGGPDIPDTFYEALVADDDDGDLGNGTPHTCEIHDAFGRHNLGTATGDSVLLAAHEPLEVVPAGQDHDLVVELTEVSGGCEAVDPDSGTVHWRVGGGAWKTTALSASGAELTGAIPEQPEGSFVEYWIDGTSVGGDAFSVPVGEDVNPFGFYVGGVLEVGCEDFEGSDGGWTHELLAGEDVEGADDWQWGPPSGASGDPTGAYSGTNVWGNDLGYDNFNGAYQANKSNRLESPQLDTLWYTDVFLMYRRWLQVEDATYDQALVTVDDEVVWANHDGAGEDQHQDSSWRSHAIDLGGRADRTKLRLGFELHTDGGLEMGGWNVDDVCLMAPATPENRLAIVDLAVTAKDDVTAKLTWTNPIHDPVERVVVVRRTDRWPDGWDDGQLTIDVTDPVAGEEVVVEDLNGFPGTTMYAVYGFDGSEWLPWTIEGWNAATVELVGGSVPGGQGDFGATTGDGGYASGNWSKMGCGCSGSGAPPVAALALVALALARRRAR